MFGMEKRRAIRAAFHNLQLLLGPMRVFGKPLPQGFWDDPYVVGFIDKWILFSAYMATNGKLSARDKLSVFLKVLDGLSDKGGIYFMKKAGDFVAKGNEKFYLGSKNATKCWLAMHGNDALSEDYVRAREYAEKMTSELIDMGSTPQAPVSIGDGMLQMLFYGIVDPDSFGAALNRDTRDTALNDVASDVARRLPDLAVFRDVDQPWCPEMVALEPGSFLMGSPDSDTQANANEKPQHEVTIGYRFAAGRTPVTFAEYDRFCAATGRPPPNQMGGWGRERRPVINVSWHDARAYCQWLAGETGKPYRLLTEAEWEYACRAGTTTRYSIGDEITERDANFGYRVDKTTEVGNYPANPWGLYDMHGNVSEWVEDDWHDSYQGAPADGSAWSEKEGKESSSERVVRGGSWGSDPRHLRSADRIAFDAYLRFLRGFRVARTLD